MKRAGLVLLAVSVAIGLVAAPVAAKGDPRLDESVADCSAGTSCTITWPVAATPLNIYASTDINAIDRSTPVFTSLGNETTTTVSGLDPAKRYYFELVLGTAKNGVVIADRSLRLPTSPNSRDIGGYETKDGHHVKWGTVFRSEEIIELTDPELIRLANFGIKIVCDFRGDAEVEKRGEDQLPAGAEYVHLPVLDDSNTLPTDIENAIVNKDFEAQERLLGEGRATALFNDNAKYLIESKAARKAYSSLMDRLTDPAALPAFTHCTTGKDRTGWSTAIILTALGVPRDTIIEDYLLTNEYAAEKNAGRIEDATPLMEHPEYLVDLLEVRSEYLETSFDAVNKKYGSFANYLRKGLGVSKADLKKLEQNLLTD